MSATITIDQVGLPAGVPDRSRTDGLATGAVVTLTNTGTGSTTRFQILWTPPGDTTAVMSLGPTGPNTWTFVPTASQYGSYSVECIEDEGLPTENRSTRKIVVRTPNLGLVIPALNERASFTASLVNKGPRQVAASLDNSTDYPSPLDVLDYAGWWRAYHELFMAVDSGGGGGGGTITGSGVAGQDVFWSGTTLLSGGARMTVPLVMACVTDPAFDPAVGGIPAPAEADGYSFINGDIALVLDGGNASGFYVVNAAGAWTRPSWWNNVAHVAQGQRCYVFSGDIYARSTFQLQTSPPYDFALTSWSWEPAAPYMPGPLSAGRVVFVGANDLELASDAAFTQAFNGTNGFDVTIGDTSVTGADIASLSVQGGNARHYLRMADGTPVAMWGYSATAGVTTLGSVDAGTPAHVSATIGLPEKAGTPAASTDLIVMQARAVDGAYCERHVTGRYSARLQRAAVTTILATAADLTDGGLYLENNTTATIGIVIRGEETATPATRMHAICRIDVSVDGAGVVTVSPATGVGSMSTYTSPDALPTAPPAWVGTDYTTLITTAVATNRVMVRVTPANTTSVRWTCSLDADVRGA